MPLRRRLRAMLVDNSGAALVEITLFTPVLALMSVAVINLGLGFWYSIEVENAAQAGAQWAIENAAQNGYSLSSAASIANAGTYANNTSQPQPSVFSPSITVTPTEYCDCPGHSPPEGAVPPYCATAGSTGALCSDGSYPGTYVKVVASGTFTPFAGYGSFFPAKYPLSSTATVRIQ
jgi:Flp pilus assembly protein TadG